MNCFQKKKKKNSTNLFGLGVKLLYDKWVSHTPFSIITFWTLIPCWGGMLPGSTPMENSLEVSWKNKNRAGCHPAIPLLVIYPPSQVHFSLIYFQETKAFIQKDICTPLLTAPLSIVARTWNQMRCSTTDEWIIKSWHGTGGCHIKWSESEGQILGDLTYVWYTGK